MDEDDKEAPAYPVYLQEWMTARGFKTQKALAAAMRVNEPLLSKKLGSPGRLSVVWLGRFAAVFQIHAADLFRPPTASDAEALRQRPRGFSQLMELASGASDAEVEQLISLFALFPGGAAPRQEQAAAPPATRKAKV